MTNAEAPLVSNVDDAQAPESPGAAPGLAAHSGQADLIDRLARKVSKPIRRYLLSDRTTQVQLRSFLAEMGRLQDCVGEWLELHRLLHEVVSAFTPFHTLVVTLPASPPNVRLADRQALLYSWKPCQDTLDDLGDFAEGVKCIGPPLRRDGGTLSGESWAVDIIALQAVLEDILKEDNIQRSLTLEVSDEFNTTCHRHLIVSDRALRSALTDMHWLYGRLLGGML
jgi:hypothetical protein